MNARDAAFLGIGALVSPLAYHFACRFSGKHWLSVQLKESL